MTSLFKKNKYAKEENGTEDDCCIPGIFPRKRGKKGMNDVMEEGEEDE